jgi:AsmA protein
VDITHPETATILRNFAKMNPTKNLGAFALKTNVAAGNGQIVADPFQVKLGDAGGLQGKIIAAKNNIDINLEGRTLDLAALTGDSSSANASNNTASANTATGWSTTPINLSFLHNASGKVRLKLDNFAVKKFKFEPFELNANVNSGTLTISQLGGGMFDGTANVSGTLKAGDVNQAHQGNFDVAVKDVQVKKFFGSLNSKAFESGVVNVTQNLRFNGASQANIISTLNGDGTLQVNDGVLNGFDLDAIAGKMDRFNSLTDAMNMLSQLKAGGTTKFSNLDGKVLIRNGVITPQNMFMTTEKTRTEFSGQANAPAQYVDMHGLVNFTKQKNMPPLGLVVKGPFSNPYKGLDTGSIENFAKQKLQDAATKKLQEKLQDKFGDKFPFLKQGGTTTPTETVPAAETPAPAADNVAPAETTPAPAAKPAPKPEDALKDAANDLLKGALGF